MTVGWKKADACGPPATRAPGRTLRGRGCLPAPGPPLELVPGWAAFVGGVDDERFNELLRGHAGTGWPLGQDSFVEFLERLLARSLTRKKPGSKTRERDRTTGDLFSEEGRS